MVFGTILKRVAQTLVLTALLVSVASIVSDRLLPLRATEGARTAFGSYLAGRFASAHRDTFKAASFYRKALDRDPNNKRILQEAFFLEATAGNHDRADKLAGELLKGQDEKTAANNNRAPAFGLARTFLGVKAFQDGKFEEADKYFASDSIVGPIPSTIARLSRAWTFHARGKSNSAYALLDDSGKTEWIIFYKQYHRAIIAAVSGDVELAKKTFEVISAKDKRNVRISRLYAHFAAKNGDWKLAEEVARRSLKETRGAVESEALLQDILAKKLPNSIISNSKEGLSEVYYGFGEALSGDNGVDMATIYLQLALDLRPTFTPALRAIAKNYEVIARADERANKSKELAAAKYGLANSAYDRIPESDPLWFETRIRKAYNLNAVDRVSDSEKLLKKLIAQKPEAIEPLNALGAILRSHKRFKEAATYYGKAIELTPNPKQTDWNLFYARGICFERIKEWPKAEADLKKALELRPNQPLVLNYLGYSWVDQGNNIEEAMGLIRKAVRLKPNDGYFVDSLGWAYYRQGKFEDATRELEKAVELQPDDPVINDHLGDAYWQVGRRKEARFQWSQALTLEPEPEEVKKIEAKLKDGLSGDSVTSVKDETDKGDMPK